MKGVLLAGVLGSLCLLVGCGHGFLVLRSNHYRIVVPEGWKVEDARSPGLGSPAVLRVPPAEIDPAGGGLELRVYGWVDTTTPDEATAQALARLSQADDPTLRAVVSSEGETCEASKKVWLLGEYRRAVYLRGAADRLIVVTAGKADGSVVAVVGTVMPNRQPLCENVLAVRTAMTKLGTVLKGGGDLNRVGRPPVVLEQPNTGHPIFVPPLD